MSGVLNEEFYLLVSFFQVFWKDFFNYDLNFVFSHLSANLCEFQWNHLGRHLLLVQQTQEIWPWSWNKTYSFGKEWNSKPRPFCSVSSLSSKIPLLSAVPLWWARFRLQHQFLCAMSSSLLRHSTTGFTSCWPMAMAHSCVTALASSSWKIRSSMIPKFLKMY